MYICIYNQMNNNREWMIVNLLQLFLKHILIDQREHYPIEYNRKHEMNIVLQTEKFLKNTTEACLKSVKNNYEIG